MTTVSVATGASRRDQRPAASLVQCLSTAIDELSGQVQLASDLAATDRDHVRAADERAVAGFAAQLALMSRNAVAEAELLAGNVVPDTRRGIR